MTCAGEKLLVLVTPKEAKQDRIKEINICDSTERAFEMKVDIMVPKTYRFIWKKQGEN